MRMNGIGRWMVMGVVVFGLAVAVGTGLRAHAQSTGVSAHGCTIHFTGGKVLKFNYSNSDVGAVDRFLQALGTATVWVLELDGKTYIIPTQNVDYLEIDPAVRNFTGPVLKGTLSK